MKLNRVENSITNTVWGFAEKFLTLIGPFAVRTVLIYQLSAEYSGLNSLFTSILSLLSLSELGFSNAIVYSMYKPIAEDDRDTICALLNLYKKAYRIIGCVILALGLVIIPFLSILISGEVPEEVSVYSLYLIFLFNMVISYFMFAYKTSLLSAHQKQSVMSRNHVIVNTCMYIFQIAVLFAFRNYYLYVILLPVSTIAMNLLNSRMVDRLYPEYICTGTVSLEQKQDIKKQLIGLMLSKIGQSTRNTLDSIVISAYLGLSMVTMYNNYYLILTFVSGILGIFTTAMTAGVGNKIASCSVEENYRDFNKFWMIYMFVVNWAVVCMLCLYQPFMEMWMGKKLMLSNLCMVLFCVYFFILKSGDINSMYYQATGLWWRGRYRSIIEAILNITLNLLLGYYFGVIGIILATIISMLCILGYASSIVFWYYFKSHSPLEYFLQLAYYAVVALITSVVSYSLCEMFTYGASRLQILGNLAFRLAICSILACLSAFVFYRFNSNYRNALNFLRSVAMKGLKKRM